MAHKYNVCAVSPTSSPALGLPPHDAKHLEAHMKYDELFFVLIFMNRAYSSSNKKIKRLKMIWHDKKDGVSPFSILYNPN